LRDDVERFEHSVRVVGGRFTSNHSTNYHEPSSRRGLWPGLVRSFAWPELGRCASFSFSG
jgi:hypothetical protein